MSISFSCVCLHGSVFCQPVMSELVNMMHFSIFSVFYLVCIGSQWGVMAGIETSVGLNIHTCL